MKKNKTICAALVLSLLLPIFSGIHVSFAAETAVDLAAVETLKDLGAAEYDDDTDFEATVTRAQFCALLLKYLNLEGYGMSSSDTTPFIDVDPARADFKAIRTVYDLGFIAGVSNRRFYPDREITGTEALTILTSGIGYQQEALYKGGYPDGYVTVAREQKILKNTSLNLQQPIRLGDIYEMFYYALEVPILSLVIEGAQKMFTAEDEKTVLSTYYKAEKKRGKVTANRYTGLSAAEGAVLKGQIGIDETTYAGDKDYSGWLGKYVEYYISYMDEDSGVVVHIGERKTDNIQIQIDADNIENVSPTSISYLENEDAVRAKKASISNNADVIYNGQACTGYGTLMNIVPENGNIVLLDNNKDGNADVVFITAYENFFIGGLNKTDKIIYDYDGDKQLNLDTTKHTVEIFDAAGESVKFSALKTSTLISVARSIADEEQLIRVYICGTVVNGTVYLKDTDECTIEGTVYKIAPDIAAPLKSKDAGEFFLDVNGKIAAFKMAADSSYVYGLVYRIVEDTDNERVLIKIFTESETFVDYVTAEKVIINKAGYKADTEDGRQKILEAVARKMVVRYRLNAEGRISHIETPKEMDTDKAGNKTTANTLDYRVLYEGSSFKYRNGLMDGKLVINSDTVIFSVPKEEKWQDKNAFGKLTSGAFSGGSTYSKNYTAYAIGEKPISIADALLIEDMTKGGIGNGTGMVLVTGVNDGLNADDQICKIITGVAGGNAAEYICEDEELVTENNLARGDIIRVGTDSQGAVSKIQKIYNAEGTTGNGALLQPEEGAVENTASFDSEFRVVTGTVMDVKDNYMKISLRKKSTDGFYTDETICGISGASVIRYESKYTNSVPAAASPNELIKGDKVVVRMNLGNAKEIVILR